ncbi:hypothetical protein OBBRIDRAFT_321306 [Obba rivulosa]|uniref:Nephrocystin 3-like N-terminal domain-containing protein n=1 Tax=Obba rivulosa TaxID=1052685 RepID=A0A8E2AIV7_9APHY|nr:hypothetical protein OBBRIDRAFT_321306 [Obba rivulosa]
MSNSRFPLLICAIAIDVNPKSKGLHPKSTVKLTTGDTSEHKFFYRKKFGALRWDLKSPREILPGTPFEIEWRTAGSSKPFIVITLHYDDLIERMEIGTSNVAEHKYECDYEHARVTVIFRSMTPDIRPDGMKKICDVASRRKSILDRLGKSKVILETVNDYGGALGSLNPALGSVIGCVQGVYGILKKQDEENGDVLDLVSDMSDIIGYIFDVNQFATIAQLKTVIEEMKGPMQEASQLVMERDQRSHFKDAVSFLTSNDRHKIDNLKARFRRFKERFDRGVSVQSAENMDIIRTQVEKFASAQEEYIYLQELNPGYTKSDPPRCLAGTREDILSTIREWTNDPNSPNILWIAAYPGAGKSTIAFTIAAELERSHRMGAIFAFDRKAGTSPSVLWRYIAFALTREYPNCRDHIVATLKGNPSILTNMTATEIFHKFVADPLQQWNTSSAIIPRNRLPVLIIEALDECGGLGGSSSRDRKDILSHIAEWTNLSPHLKLIITSRAEDDIENAFLRIPHKALSIGTADAVSPQSTRDIQQYIEHRFKEIATDRPYLPPCWPGKTVVDDLTSRASGVFIWAATALSYIEGFPCDKRLNDVQGGTLPSGDVHALYRRLLAKSFSKWSDTELAHFVKLVGAIVVTQISLTPAEFGCLLGMEEATVGNICNRLRPVLAVGNTLRFAHPSFVDFLLGHTTHSTDDSVNDEWSCPEAFRIDPAVAHRHLTESMFPLMNERLCFNICNIESSFVRNAALPQSQVEKAIDRPLSYACRFWGFHVEQTRHDANLASSHVSTFLQEKLLFWLEAVGVLGAVNVAAAALARLIEHTAVEADISILKDALKFVQYFAPAIAESAPHIYVSCLPFAPRSSGTANCYALKFRNTISLQRGRLQDWPAEQTVIRGHDSSVFCVAFSPDGKRVISGSEDRTIRIWDAETGRTMTGPFNGHRDRVCSVACSPDGKRVVSGSSDKTIRIWDAETGRTVVGPLNGHEGSTTSVAFSPDGKRVVSGSFDKTIRI